MSRTAIAARSAAKGKKKAAELEHHSDMRSKRSIAGTGNALFLESALADQVT